MKPIFIYTVLLVASLNIFGQPKSQNSDTLIVYTNDNVIIKTAVYENAWLKRTDVFPEIIDKCVIQTEYYD